MPNPEIEALLRERIDDLSTRLLLGDPETDDSGAGQEQFLTALEQISRQAGDGGYADAARIAGDLSAALEQAPAGEPALERLEEGIARLQEALTSGGSHHSLRDAGPETQAGSVLTEDPELVGDFIVESREHLTSIERRILVLEREPHNSDAINSVFRGFHTIKGLAGFLEYAPIQAVAHEVETALNLVREGTLAITTAVIDAILESVDYLNRSIAGIESGAGCRPMPGHERLLDRIRGVAAGEPAVPSGVGAFRRDAPSAIPGSTAGLEEHAQVRPPNAAERVVPPASGAAPGGPRALEEHAQVRPPNAAERVVPPASGAAPGGPRAPKMREPAAPPVPLQTTRKRSAAESSSVRVDTARLDYLVDMVSETVIAQSMVRHNRTLAGANDPILQRDLTQLARLTVEVQKTAMAMRMVPIGQLFQRANRQVRDLSRKIGKQVELIARGEDTQLDKNIAEELADPLMHMVRNSIDHGIEPPEDRETAGKTAVAAITVAAYHRAGQIVIEIADDGRGLDARKILAKARQKGLVEDGVHLSEADTFRLILEAGFSTSETVSDISGRGVGMDVVRRQVEKLRGRIEIRSHPGHGTTFLLKLPLTMAIIDGLVVSIGGQRYIVPLYAVTEMFRPAPESIFTVQNRQEMAMVRERLLPVLRLYKRFGLAPRTEDPCQALLIVAESEGRSFCLLVDELIGKQEVVIKSLGEGLGKVPGIAGGAILGDGRVGLILDMGGLWGAHAGL